MAPGRDLHRLPLAEGFQAEFEKPVRLVLLVRDQADDILVQTLGDDVLIDMGLEAFGVFARRDLVQQCILVCLVCV
jgi:hypothetical protein